MIELLLALLFYPGIALGVVLALATAMLTNQRRLLLVFRNRPNWRSLDTIAAISSLLLAGIALALAPWPLHPAAADRIIGQPLLIFLALEAAFLVPVLTALIAPSPTAGRAAIREAQIGIAGRVVLWLAIGSLLGPATGWGSAPGGSVLLAIAVILALPAAIGHGPFAAERTISPAGAEEGLDSITTTLLQAARLYRATVTTAISVLALLPPIGAVPELLLAIALFLLITRGLSRIASLPRLPLPAALRWCWWPALVCALGGVVWLGLA
ncbi:MAG TPA: hypothetical protein PKC19_12215 [Roseiflexaceae bacterium]|nr:hypothetical protein [Roseiflexaceae bacterium]